MKVIKKILKWMLFILLIPVVYLIISLILTLVTIDRKVSNQTFESSIFLSTNGVHLDIVIPKKNVDSLLLTGLQHKKNDTYLSFGWGDENFYINTPTWADLTIVNACKAMFLKSTTLMHVTRYEKKRSDWIEIKVSKSEMQKVNAYLLKTFKIDDNGNILLLENEGYSKTDAFYKANGSYSLFNTSNSWVNDGFKQSGLKACLWTPFDFGLMNKYE